MTRKLRLPAIVAWMLAEGCSNASSSGTANSDKCIGPTCQSGTQSKDEYTIVLGSAGSGGSATGAAGMVTRAPLPKLCSVQQPTCDPDSALACAFSEAGGSTGRAANSHAGATDSSSLTQDTSVGVAGSSPASACRVVRDGMLVATRCDIAGMGTLGAPCVSDANCAAGFSCVEEAGTAQCRPYCCRGADSCPIGTYCDLRSVKELQDSIDSIWVSVCMPGAPCRFDEPYPCPADKKCSCPSGKTCGAVRGDGTTACVVPGDGTEGKPCPCAANHVCADALGSCLKVCDLTSRDPSCGEEGICQTSANLPFPWGLCVSSSALL